MKISFVIPAYNEELLIKDCLESVKKEVDRVVEMDRNLKDKIEVIVVNNASNDKTKEYAQEFAQKCPHLKIVDETRKGLVWARRAGYSASTGELIANVDADTILPVGWLTTVLEKFEKDENLVALSGPFIYYDLSFVKRILVKIFYFAGFAIYFVNHFIFNKGAMLQGGNFILKRSALEKAGGFDTTIEFYGEDTDIARRISPFGKVLWTFELPIYTSGRRLEKQGIVTTGTLYAINLLWVSFFHVPFTKKYTDIRFPQKNKNKLN